MTDKDGEDTIHLKVKSQENDEVFFKIKRSTQLGKLMQKYCERQGVPILSLRYRTPRT